MINLGSGLDPDISCAAMLAQDARNISELPRPQHSAADALDCDRREIPALRVENGCQLLQASAQETIRLLDDRSWYSVGGTCVVATISKLPFDARLESADPDVQRNQLSGALAGHQLEKRAP